MNNVPAPPPSTPLPTTCPKCGGGMTVRQVACPHCGYDFPIHDLPGTNPPREKTGLAYSAFADLALSLGIAFSGIGAFFSLLMIVVLPLVGHYVEAFVSAPISFFSCFLTYIVLQRVADMD